MLKRLIKRMFGRDIDVEMNNVPDFNINKIIESGEIGIDAIDSTIKISKLYVMNMNRIFLMRARNVPTDVDKYSVIQDLDKLNGIKDFIDYLESVKYNFQKK